MTISDIVTLQKTFFNSNQTKSVTFRLNQLKTLKKVLKDNESLLYNAILSDFGKSAFDTYMTELSLVYHELNLSIKHIKKWSKRKKVATNFANFPARSYIIPEPLGNTLVIGAWNYPYQLSLVPAIAALTAGNTVILKPSEIPGETSKKMASLINENFDKAYFHVLEGGVAETTTLLEQKFDKIFFTGSTPVGKIIYQAAAKNLTPVTLELGGKCPTFVLKDSNLKMTAKRLVWAKFINGGQTCVAPDYILVDESIKQAFLEALTVEIKEQYPILDKSAENYPQIINDANFERLVKLIPSEKLFLGGEYQKENRIIQPTILQNISWDDKIMDDEIFGPILPVLSFDDLKETINMVKARPKPLACYIFSKDRKAIDRILHEVSFGGGAVNDAVMHLSNSNLPFGGVGYSGMGSYHGKVGFDTFSHFKSILDKPLWYESKIKYAPYSIKKLNVMKKLME